MRALIVLVLLASLAGCEISASEATTAKRGAARVALFKECMELAAKMSRQSDDAVPKVVEQCSSQALYMTNYLQ